MPDRDRTIGRCCLYAAGIVCFGAAAGPAIGQALVLRSEARAHPAGQRLPGDAPITLAAGERVLVLRNGATRLICGPIRLSLAAPNDGQSCRRPLETVRRRAAAVTPVSVDGRPTPPAPAAPAPEPEMEPIPTWEPLGGSEHDETAEELSRVRVNIRAAGTYCYSQAARISLEDRLHGEQVTVDGKPIDWERQAFGWLTGSTAVSGRAYRIARAGHYDSGSVDVTLHRIEHDADGGPEAAAEAHRQMQKAGCLDQLFRAAAGPAHGSAWRDLANLDPAEDD